MITVKYYDKNDKFLGSRVFNSLEEYNKACEKNLREGYPKAKWAKTFSDVYMGLDGIHNEYLVD